MASETGASVLVTFSNAADEAKRVTVKLTSLKANEQDTLRLASPLLFPADHATVDAFLIQDASGVLVPWRVFEAAACAFLESPVKAVAAKIHGYTGCDAAHKTAQAKLLVTPVFRPLEAAAQAPRKRRALDAAPANGDTAGGEVPVQGELLPPLAALPADPAAVCAYIASAAQLRLPVCSALHAHLSPLLPPGSIAAEDSRLAATLGALLAEAPVDLSCEFTTTFIATKFVTGVFGAMSAGGSLHPSFALHRSEHLVGSSVPHGPPHMVVSAPCGTLMIGEHAAPHHMHGAVEMLKSKAPHAFGRWAARRPGCLLAYAASGTHVQLFAVDRGHELHASSEAMDLAALPGRWALVAALAACYRILEASATAMDAADASDAE